MAFTIGPDFRAGNDVCVGCGFDAMVRYAVFIRPRYCRSFMVTWEKKQNFRSPRFSFLSFLCFLKAAPALHSLAYTTFSSAHFASHGLRMFCRCTAQSDYTPVCICTLLFCRFHLLPLHHCRLHLLRSSSSSFLLPTMNIIIRPHRPFCTHRRGYSRAPGRMPRHIFLHQMPPLPVQCSCACSKRRCGCPKVHQSLSPLSCDTVSSSTIPPLPRSVLAPGSISSAAFQATPPRCHALVLLAFKMISLLPCISHSACKPF